MEGIELLYRKKSEKMFSGNLPLIYSIFVKHYATGWGGFRTKYLKFNEDLIQLTCITYFGRDGYENSVSHFLNASELENEMRNFRDSFDKYHEMGFIRIGLFDINDSILLGVSQANIDTIWKLNGDWGDERPYIEKLSNNIFEFINNLKEVVIKLNLMARQINEDQLYKDWGENFWRVREDEEESDHNS